MHTAAKHDSKAHLTFTSSFVAKIQSLSEKKVYCAFDRLFSFIVLGNKRLLGM